MIHVFTTPQLLMLVGVSALLGAVAGLGILCVVERIVRE